MDHPTTPRPTGGAPANGTARSREAILSALTAFPEELGRLINGQPPEALMRPGSDGGWGVIEILCHLRDWEEIYLDRAQAIVQQDRPHLPAFDDELWAIERDYRGQAPQQTFEQFRELRRQLVELLQSLPAEGWARVGDHAHHGEISIQWLANHIVNHDEEHLTQARDALA
jgi:hypothetical protein